MTRSSVKHFLRNTTEDSKIEFVSPVFQSLYNNKNITSINDISLMGDMVIVHFTETVKNKSEDRDFSFGVDYLLKI